MFFDVELLGWEMFIFLDKNGKLESHILRQFYFVQHAVFVLH